jgi:hypothetical protein
MFQCVEAILDLSIIRTRANWGVRIMSIVLFGPHHDRALRRGLGQPISWFSRLLEPARYSVVDEI